MTMAQHGQSDDAVLSAVADEHCRVLIGLLADVETSISLEALVDQIAGQPRNTDLFSEPHRRQTRISLHHIHLPKLADCGIIAYDTEAKQILPADTELAEELLATLEMRRGTPAK